MASFYVGYMLDKVDSKVNVHQMGGTTICEYKDGKYTTKTRFYVDYIDYDDNRKIKDLLIRDNKNNIRFEEFIYFFSTIFILNILFRKYKYTWT